MRARVRALLDVGALRENVRLLSEHAGARVLLPVKANGYGHGLREVVGAVRDLPQVWGFAVAVPDEAAQALEVAGGKPVLLLTPAEPDEARELARMGVRLSVSGDAEARDLPPGARAHLKVNTGMNRLGVRPERALELAEVLRDRGALEGVFTHFAAADEEDTAHAREQLRVFAGLAERLPGVLAHASNSGGVLAFGRQAGFDLVRPGIASYGFAPPHLAGVVSLRPALSVQARVTFVHDVPAGESVGYACLWTAKRDTRVAVVAFGYADGFPRRATGQAWVRVRGERREVLGRICMDQFMLDVTGLDVRPGEWLEVFGPGVDPDGVTARDVAAWAGTNEYEILTGLGARVERRLLHGGAESPAG